MKTKMISRLLILTIIGYSLGLLPAAQEKAHAADELLQNADFEDVSNGKPSQWAAWDASDFFTSVSDSQYVRSGNYSVRLDDPSATTSTGLQSAHIPVSAGTTYRTKVYAFDVSGTSQLYLEYWNSSNQRIGVQYVSNPSLNAWNRLDIVMEAPPGAVSATVLLYLHGANVGTSYFDSASFQVAPPLSDPNFGFEDVFDGKPSNWSDLEGNGLYQSVTNIVNSGTYSVKLEDPSSVYSTGIRSIKMPVTAGEEYQASVMTYNVSGESQLYLEYWDSSNQRIGVQYVTNSSQNEWNRLDIVMPAPSGAVSATVLLYLHGVNVGTSYFDRASFLLDPNFGFEDVFNGKPSNWSDLEGNGLYQSATNIVNSRTYSVKLEDPSSVYSTGIRSIKMPVTAGEEYRASVMTYNVSGESQLYLEYWDSSNERIGVQNVTNLSLGTWKRLENVLRAPSGAVYATILLYLHGANMGTSYFDNVTFEVDPNFGFEYVADGKPSSWSNAGVGAYQSATDIVNSGIYSVKLDDPSPTDNTGVRSGRMPVTAGEVYKASVMSYNVAGDSYLFLEYWDGSNNSVGTKYIANTSQNEWKRLDVALAAPGNAVSATLLLYLGGANVGTSYFDSASFKVDPNLEFESAADGKPSNWSNAYGTGTYQSATEIVYNGSYGIKLEDPSTVYATGIRSMKMPVSPGELYKASVMSLNISGESHLYLQYWNSFNEPIGVQFVTNSSINAWKRLEIVMQAPSGAASATVMLYQSGANTGTTYFDSATFELAPNFDFEVVSNGKPSNWSNPDGTGTYQSATDIVSSGTHSIKLEDPSSVTSTGIRSIKMPVTPGIAYRASVKNYNVSGVSDLYLEYWNSSDVRIDVQVATNSSTGSWQQITIDSPAPSGVAYATLLLYSNSVNVGSAYFDAASFGDPVREFPLVVNTHPRLYFTGSDIPALRAKANNAIDSAFGATGKQLWTVIENVARKYLNETEFTITYETDFSWTYSVPPQMPAFLPGQSGYVPDPPGYTAGSRYPIWTSLSKRIQERMETLSLAYVITQEQLFADKAKQYLMAMTAWDSWTDVTLKCESHTCLDTAHITMGVSMAYDVLYDQLTESERAQVEAAIETKGLEPLYLDANTREDNNIELLRAVGLGIGATVMLGKLQNANKYLTRATNYYKWYMDSRMSSGKQEGMLYTDYSVEHTVRAVDTITRATGLSELISHPFLNDFIVSWANYFLAPGGGGLANFSDSQYDNYLKSPLNVLNNVLQDGHAGAYLNETGNFNPYTQLLSFLYFNPNPTITSLNDLPSSTVLDEIGWAALRSGWEKNDTLFALVGNNSRLGHNQHDQNSFQIATNRSWIAADPGYRDFSAGPNNDFTVRYGHNTIQVDGQPQSELGGGSLTKGMLSSTYNYIKGSAANAYANPKLDKFDRHVVYLKKPNYFVMFDDLSAPAAHTYDWVLYSGYTSEATVDGNAVTLPHTTSGNNLFIRNDRAALTMKFLSPGTPTISTQTYPELEEYGYYTKVYSGAPAQDYRLVTVLKATPVNMPGQYMATDLLPAIDTSDKLVRVTSALTAAKDTHYVVYQGDQADDYMTFQFNVETAGTYSLKTVFAKGPANGNVQAYLDGQLIGDVFVGYNDTFTIQASTIHGDVTLQAGTHTMRYQIVDKNASSLDYAMAIHSIQLTPVGHSGPPQPQFEKQLDAELVSGTGVIGAEVNRGGSNALIDTVLFKTGNAGYQILGIESDAEQSVVTHNSNAAAAGLAMTRGTSLKYGGTTYMKAQSLFNAAFEYSTTSGAWTGTVEAGASPLTFSFHSPSAQVEVTVDGQILGGGEWSYDTTGQLVSFTVPAGTHAVVVRQLS